MHYTISIGYYKIDMDFDMLTVENVQTIWAIPGIRKCLQIFVQIAHTHTHILNTHIHTYIHEQELQRTIEAQIPMLTY